MSYVDVDVITYLWNIPALKVSNTAVCVVAWSSVQGFNQGCFGGCGSGGNFGRSLAFSVFLGRRHWNLGISLELGISHPKIHPSMLRKLSNDQKCSLTSQIGVFGCFRCDFVMRLQRL